MSSPSSEKPPARGASSPPELHEARVRARHLRTEAELVADRTAKAALLYEAGYLHEILLHQPAQAAQDYLAAYNVDNRSRLPLHALVRMFERRRSYKNLARLYDAELRAARSSSERGTALTDHAVLAALTGGDGSAVQRRLEQALEHEPRTEAALLLEWNRRADGDLEGAMRALDRRAESCDDGPQRAALLLELARVREARGEVSSALEALREAALAPGVSDDLYPLELARFARRHGQRQELAEANERHAARLASALNALDGAAEGDAQRERLRAAAVAHWYEAARVRCTALGDPQGALRSLDAALALSPERLELKQLRMFAYDLLEDRERAAEEARSLLAAGAERELAAALHFRLAERALVLGDTADAREKLGDAITASGGSLAAESLLDDLLLDSGRHAERRDRRLRAAEASEASGRKRDAALALAEAAHVAAYGMNDAEAARGDFARAHELAPDDEVLAREAYGTALDCDDPALAREAIDRLLSLPLPADERAALVQHRYELSDTADRLALIDAELGREREPEIPHGAVIQAAQARDYARLAELHEALAAIAEERELAEAERCAAARAFLRANEPDRARALLTAVLEEHPAHDYALTLLEEVMRRQGDATGAVDLLREAAKRHEDTRATALQLLAAGSAAEAAGEAARAAQCFREAASTFEGLNEDAHAALWALFRLGQRAGDRALEREAREKLVQREQARGDAHVETLLYAEQLDLGEHQPAAAQAQLVPALRDADVGHHAAVALALSRTAPVALREQALELLATRATDSLRPALLRQLGGELVAHSGRAARVLDLAERVTRARPDDRWALWTRTHTLGANREDEPSALEALASVTTDLHVADAARAEALWARQLAAPEQPMALALEALPPTPDELGGELGSELASCITAIASPAHDASLRAQALRRLSRDAAPERKASALLELARAELGNDDPEAALAALNEHLALEPDSLAGWELAYAAANDQRDPKLLAEAAVRLADVLGGDDAAKLLEQAADVYLDDLEDRDRAEALLERALAIAPTRAQAYARLHESLVERGDDEAVMALVRRRIAVIDEPDLLVKLYYELARLERKRGDVSAAFEAADHALMLDDEHVGALALLAEVHTTRGDFKAAVDAFDRLGRARSLPATQRRLALLGAADFLEHRLDDRAGALARLERLAEREPGEAALQVRIADLCERIAREPASDDARRREALTRAATALARAAELEKGEARVAHGLRRAQLLERELDRASDAAEQYRRVLELAPDRLEAARAHFALTGDRELRGRVELELRARAQARPRAPEPLHKLLAFGEFAEDPELCHVALVGLAALGALPSELQARYEESVREARKRRPAARSLTDAELRPLLTPSVEGDAALLARSVFAQAAELDQLEPSRFGVGRGQRVPAKEASPLRDELASSAASFGIALDELYRGGPEPRRIAALPRDGKLSFVVGGNLASPLDGPARYELAQQVAAAYLDTLPLLTRGPEGGVLLLAAALASEDLPLPPGVAREQLAELPRTVGKALPRRVRRGLGELLRQRPSAREGLDAYCRGALAHTRRLALLLSGELEAALAAVDRDGEEGADLLRTWTGSALTAARRKLGLAT